MLTSFFTSFLWKKKREEISNSYLNYHNHSIAQSSLKEPVNNRYRYAFGFHIQNAPIDSHDLHGIPGTF